MLVERRLDRNSASGCGRLARLGFLVCGVRVADKLFDPGQVVCRGLAAWTASQTRYKSGQPMKIRGEPRQRPQCRGRLVRVGRRVFRHHTGLLKLRRCGRPGSLRGGNVHA
jgi:hypothetical protein